MGLETELCGVASGHTRESLGGFTPFENLYSCRTMMRLLASYSVLTEVQQIHSGKKKLTPLLAGHLSYPEVENLRDTRGQSDENRDGKNDLETCLGVTSLQS